MGHTATLSGNSKSICDGIIEKINKNVQSNILAVGCDRTVSNTGHKTGVIRRLEEKFNKPMQWLICLLHLNELPLRHMFQQLDGPTCGPSGFSGPLGKFLERSKELDIVDFAIIKCNVPTITSELSTDQKYLFDAVVAISTGKCSNELARRNPGNISHARWLTTANHILRTYMGTKVPSKSLVDIATFILKVYAETWFDIKLNSNCINGTKHFFNLIKRSRYLDIDQKKIVHAVLKRNGYFAHAENVILAMLFDDKKEIRQKAYEVINI